MSLVPPLPFAVDRLRTGRRAGLRHVLDGRDWDALAADPPTPGAAPLLGLWFDGSTVNALFHEGRQRPVVTSVMPEGLRFRGLSRLLPAAIPYERRIRDLQGLEAMSAVDLRPVLDHGLWSNDLPLATPPGPPPRAALPAEWEEHGDRDEGAVIHERGPISSFLPGIRMRATIDGATVRRVELRAGTFHRGIAAAASGLPLADACRLVERIDGESAVSHALAFSRAAEAALEVAPPEAAIVLRVVASEWERIASVLSIVARGASAAGCCLLATHAASLLTTVRDVALAAFGHRFLWGFVVPGGVSHPLDGRGRASLAEAADALLRDAATLQRLYEGRDGLARPLGASGRVTAAVAGAFSAGGPVARASGLGYDARAGGARLLAAEPFLALSPTTEDGTADARFRLRLTSLAASAARIGRALAAVAAAERTGAPGQVGPLALFATSGEASGIGVAEGPEGDLWHVLSLDADGRVADLFVRDPAVAHAALFERSAGGTTLELLGAVAHSFGFRAEAIDG